MKKIFLIFLFFLTACNDLINPKPQDGVLAETYFANTTAAEAGVIAIYNRLISRELYLQDRVMAVELLGGNIYPPNKTPPPFHDTYTHNIPTSAQAVFTLWSSFYTAIGRANNVLYGIADMKGAEALYGETLFLRALMYFDLMRIYGDVPLVLEPTQVINLNKIYVKRTPKEEIYKQIVTDLLLAEVLCPSEYATTAATKGRATKWAAKMLLGKVYLYLGKYAESEKKLAEIESSAKFIIAPIQTIFKINNIPESIWELQITSNTGHLNSALLPRNLGGQGQIAVEPNLLKMYENGDLRLTNYLYKENPPPTPTNQPAPTSATSVIKYQKNNAFQTDNIMVMRYAETLLIYAESAARNANAVTEKAVNLLNAIRTRAGLNPKKTTDFANLEAFIDELLWERRRELIGEFGETWFDLVRTDKAFDWLKLKSKNLYVIPIPDAELRNNPNLTQNAGY
ncbi:MAG: RagB/SusD family nutrient uptake outer membrane protein [Bacteroidetes bacterium]|nr:MAG: RagB/SusD family nutrient uptake outer membrane protein [Bacteroidota bacterium]